MEHPRRLNPHAPPFYPSKSLHFRPSHHAQPPPPSYQSLRPPPPPTIATHKKPICYPLKPVHRGPRNRLCGFTLGKGPPVGGGNGGCRKFREIIPLKPDENCTSVMIRNIPNNYTRSLLVEFLEKHCQLENEKEGNAIRSAFDFVYLPIDFKHRLNAGYAFVNFTTSEAALKFQTSIKGKPWELFQSKKIADVSRARIQGKDALVRNFERMRFCSPSSDYLPVWFEPARDGCVLDSSASTMHTIGEVQDK